MGGNIAANCLALLCRPLKTPSTETFLVLWRQRGRRSLSVDTVWRRRRSGSDIRAPKGALHKEEVASRSLRGTMLQ